MERTDFGACPHCGERHSEIAIDVLENLRFVRCMSCGKRNQLSDWPAPDNESENEAEDELEIEIKTEPLGDVPDIPEGPGWKLAEVTTVPYREIGGTTTPYVQYVFIRS